MVIVADRNGQLCNRLFHFSYFIANAIEYKYKLIYPCFEEYSGYFEKTDKNDFLNFPVKIRITSNTFINKSILYLINRIRISVSKIFYLDINGIEHAQYDLNNHKFQSAVHKKIVITHGWLFRDEENLRKHQDILKKIFTPKGIYLTEVQNITSKLRKEYDCIVGLHIRRGDYREWEDGKYFYSDEVYLKKISEFLSATELSKDKICFFICSNEDIDIKAYKEYNICYNRRHFMTDLYTMANCNFIIGPPSTFSQWASLYGGVPLFTITSAEAKLTMENFLSY